MLALLATAPEPGRRREQVVGLLWPDHEDVAGRHLLSDALYVLRRELGPDALVEHDGSVRLNPHRIAADTIAFRSALRQGDRDTAVRLYRGPFLDGSALAGSPEFEQWVSAERRTFQREAVEAALALARASGAEDPQLAVHWALEAQRIDPYSEEVLRELVKRLDQEGDRARAIGEYETYRERLERDLELEPSPETRMLVEEVRSRSRGRGPPPAGPRWRSPGRSPPHRRQPVRTPIHRRQPVRTPAVAKRRGSRNLPPMLAAALVVAAVVYALTAPWLGKRTEAGPATKSLAVAAFVWPAASGGTPEDEHALAEEITAALAARTGDGVLVRAGRRPAADRPRGDCLLQGTVRLEEGRLRVDVELVEPPATVPLWTASFTSPGAGPAALRQVAREIAAALDERLRYVQARVALVE